jgi:uncharacterized membrane protein YhaH (DUF805 family)
VTTPSSPQPGWYPDPSNPSQLRYWDGSLWTADPARPQDTAATAYPQQSYDELAQGPMSITDAVTTCLTKYVDFSGRARRSEYWWFALALFVVSLVVSLFGSVVHARTILSDLFSLAVFLPSLAVSVRRLHDTDRSGWWYLLVLIPVVGWIILIVFMCLDSGRGANRYGPSPKYA